MSELQSKQPMFNAPRPVVVLAFLLVAIYALQASLDDLNAMDLIRLFGFVPERITYWLEPARLAEALGTTGMAADGSDSGEMARYFLGDGSLQPWTLLTYAFLHGSWTHVLLNCLWFLSFGAAVARRFGALPFVVFCAVTAVAGALFHYVFFALSGSPVIGASAAVSGCMGGALRFAFAAGAPLGEANGLRFLNEEAAYHLPAPSLASVVQDSRAMAFLAFWFAANLLFGIGSTTFGLGDAPVAWQAHIGGLLAGFFLFSFFDGKNR